MQHHNILECGVGKMSFIQQKPSNTIVLGSDETWTIKDYRGFTVAQITDTGDIKRKGKDVKL